MRTYFFFSDTTNHPIISRILKKGYQHVEVVTEIDGFVMHINPRWGRVDVGLTNEKELADIIKRLKEMGRTCVYYKFNDLPDPKRKIMRGWAITCATYLAYTLGIPFFGVTPYQFYKHLKSRGGEDL